LAPLSQEQSALRSDAEFTSTTGRCIWNKTIEEIFHPTRLPGITERQQYVTDQKGWFITELLYDRYQQKKELGPSDGYGHKIWLVKERASDETPLVLRTEFKTDGLVLQLVACDTRHKKSTKKKDPYRRHDDDEDDDGLDRVEQVEEVESNDAKLMQRMRNEDTQYANDPQLALDVYTYKHAARDDIGENDLQVRKAQIVHSQNGTECDLARRSKLLPNASELAFHKTVKRVIGVDLGEIVTAATCLLDDDDPNGRRTKKIKRNFLYDPYWRFKRLLEQRQKETFISILHSITPSRRHGEVIKYLKLKNRPAADVLREHFGGDADNPEQTEAFEKIMRLEHEGCLKGSVGEVIFCLYHSKWTLKKRWDFKKAMTQAMDLAVSAIVDQAKGDGVAVFAIGLAVFNSGVGPASLHMELLEKLVLKVTFALS